MEKKTKADSAFADYLGGMKYKDIAEKYGVTVNTVKSLNQMFSPVQSSAEEEVRAHEGES